MSTDKKAWLKPILEPLRPVMRELLTASLFINLMALAVPIFVMQVYDRVIGHNGVATLKGLVIGVGEKMAHLPPLFAKRLRECGLRLEVMATGPAARIYNVLVNENRRVAAILLAVP